MRVAGLISVIIPFFNAESTLRQCLDSVVNQTYKNIEILLVDDGSTDQSASVYREYQEKYSMLTVIKKINGGIADGRNTGVKHSKGEYIYFLDADDWLEPNCLERALAMFNMEDDIDLVVFGHYTNDGEKDVSVSNKGLMPDEDIRVFADIPAAIYALEFSNRFPLVWNKMYKASIIEENGIEAGVKYTTGQDRDFNTKYFRYIKKCVFSDIPLHHYIKKSDNLSLSNKYKKGVYEIVDELNRNRLTLYSDLGMTENKDYMQQFYDSCVEYFHVCVPNIFRKNAPKGFKVKRDLFKQLYSNPSIKDYMAFFNPSDAIRKLFKVLYKIGSPGLSVVIYSVLFGVENNFSRLYISLRKSLNKENKNAAGNKRDL